MVTALGFANKTVKVEIGLKQDLIIIISDEATQLQQVVIGSGKYRNKGNPAVELIEKVIAHKKYNRLESHDFYNYKKYEKVEMDLVNIGDKVQNSKWLKDFKFILFRLKNSRLCRMSNKLLPSLSVESTTTVTFLFFEFVTASKSFTASLRSMKGMLPCTLSIKTLFAFTWPCNLKFAS